MRRGDDAHVHGDVARTSDATEGARLEHAQQLGLQLRRHLPDLVEEQRAPVGQLEQALARGLGVGEGATFMPVQFALQQLLGDRAAVELDEHLRGTRAVIVQVARHQLLARTGLAMDEHRAGGRLGGAVEPRQHVLEPAGLADDLDLALRLRAQMHVLGLELRGLDGVLDDDAEMIEVRRLHHEVVRAAVDRLDRVLDRAVPREHHDRQQRVGLAQVLQDLEAVVLTQLEVEHDDIDIMLAHRLERLARVGRLEGREPLAARPLADAETQGALVIDDEQRAPGTHPRRAVAFRHCVSPTGS